MQPVHISSSPGFSLRVLAVALSLSLGIAACSFPAQKPAATKPPEAPKTQAPAPTQTGPEAYPIDTIHVIVPFKAEGGVDTLARAIPGGRQ